jgi:hypothetical protein
MNRNLACLLNKFQNLAPSSLGQQTRVVGVGHSGMCSLLAEWMLVNCWFCSTLPLLSHIHGFSFLFFLRVISFVWYKSKIIERECP